jgi:hypothetical protein
MATNPSVTEGRVAFHPILSIAVLSGLPIVACSGQEEMLPEPAEPPHAERQADLGRPSGSPPANSTEPVTGCPTDTNVAELVESLVTELGGRDPRMVQFAVDSLVLLGPEARAPIACRLNDRRPMKVRPILFLNRAPHFELFGQYAPAQVIDCLAAILGPPRRHSDACSLSNGGTDEARDACVKEWQKAAVPAR